MDGLNKKERYKDLLLSTSTSDYDIICIGETWLDPTIFNSELISDNYRVFRKDRCLSNIDASKGGGVLIAIKNQIKCAEHKTMEMNDLEAVCITVPLTSGSLYIYCAYIRFGSSIEVYRSHVRAIKSIKLDANDSILIMCDFNMTGIDWQQNDDGFDYIPVIGESHDIKTNIAREITSDLLDMGLFQICNIMNSYGNVLDLIYTNIPETMVVNNADFPLLPLNKSDNAHRPLMCTIECSPDIFPSDNETPAIYCFRKADYDQIRDHLKKLDLINVISECNSDVCAMIDKFYKIIHGIFEEFVPKSTIRITNKPKWHNRELSRLKNQRNRQYKKLCDKRLLTDEADETPFLEAREKYENYRKDIHGEYIHEMLSSAKGNPRAFWRHINGKRKTNSFPKEMTYNNIKATNNMDMANLFAQFFSSVYRTHRNDHDIESFIKNRSDGNCYRISISPESVLSILSTMDTNKGSGFDGVSSYFLRQCAEILAEPLSAIFSQSIKNGHYPVALKIGQVTAIYKTGNRSNVTNYRGVNVLPNIAKVFERVLYNQLKLYIAPQISESQHGFLSNRCIETNLMEFTLRAHQAFEVGAQLDVFYADISKAFDSVDTGLLIKKLAKFPIANETLKWLVSYLSDRKQYVRVGKSNSSMFDVPSGVGQGTILGPLFFISFFNDSDPDIEGIQSFNFADDKKITAIIKNESDVQHFQRAIDKFMKWCDNNGLEVNTSKCKIMTFTTKKKPLLHEYKINNYVIDRVEEIRDLGVIMDKKLSFVPHIQYVTTKAKAILQFVKRQAPKFHIDTIKLLYSALVRSIIEFASVIWSPRFDIHKKSIESIQKQIVLFFNNDHLRGEDNYALAPYIERSMKFDLPTLTRRRINSITLFMHKIISGKIKSGILRSNLNLYDGIRTLRNPEFIRVKAHKTDLLQYSPFNNACFIFNQVALFIEPSIPYDQFRRRVLILPDYAFGPWTALLN